MQVEGFQVNALLRKSWAYQSKNISMNVCILLAPIVIAILLGVLQLLINSLLSSRGQARSNCVYSQCCVACPDNWTMHVHVALSASVSDCGCLAIVCLHAVFPLHMCSPRSSCLSTPSSFADSGLSTFHHAVRL